MPLLDIFVNTTSGYITIPSSIPKQNIKLLKYMAAFSSATDIVNCRFLKFITPFFKGNNFVSGMNSNEVTYSTFYSDGGLVLPLDYGVTSIGHPGLIVGLTDDIPESFPFSIKGINLANFASLTLYFEYS